VKSRQDIIAWRKYAAWATDAQVEQDLLLTQTMVAIFRDPFLSGQVAMRGGTALHKLHLAPAARYSEDIDLVLVGNRPVAHIERALVRVVEPLLGRPTGRALALLTVAARNLAKPSKIRRLTYTSGKGPSAWALRGSRRRRDHGALISMDMTWRIGHCAYWSRWRSLPS
jgi:hypothetical protein